MMSRYLYVPILALENFLTRYSRMMLQMIPVPDIFLLQDSNKQGHSPTLMCSITVNTSRIFGSMRYIPREEETGRMRKPDDDERPY